VHLRESDLNRLIAEEKKRVLDGEDCPIVTEGDRGIAREKISILESSREFLSVVIRNYDITETLDRTFIWDFAVILLEAQEELQDLQSRILWIQSQIPDFVESFRKRAHAN